MVLPLLTGRGVSTIRTPALIRDYLTGQGVFADDPPEELAQRLVDGAYVGQIHQRVKQYIRETRRQYQWPRRHSFHARINDLLMLGLLVETGRREEPQQRGAGRLGSAMGFSERVWVRMAPGAEARPEWADPLGYLIILKQSQDPSSYHNIRTPGRVLSAVAPVTQASPVSQAVTLVETTPVRQRRTSAQAVTLVETPERLADLEEERQALQADAESVSANGRTVQDFEGLRRAVQEFNTAAIRALGGTPFPDLAGALEILQGCNVVLRAERQMTQQRGQAIEHCRAGARLVAEALAPLLGFTPSTGTAPAEAGVVQQAFDRLVESRPNAAFAERTLDRLEAQDVDVKDARGALVKYTVITRSDYDSGTDGTEEYRDDRQQAWEAFLEAVESTEEPETEEEG